MADRTCGADGCERPLLCRGLCRSHYQRARAAGTIEMFPDRPDWHRISDLDPQALTATCSVCGPVRVRVRSGGRGAECETRRAEHRSRARKNPRNPNPLGRSRKMRAVWKYGISLEQLDALIERAGGQCEICSTPIDFDEDGCVDHDHATGAVRGILCRRCNYALGWLDDQPSRALAAHLYLTAHR